MIHRQEPVRKQEICEVFLAQSERGAWRLAAECQLLVSAKIIGPCGPAEAMQVLEIGPPFFADQDKLAAALGQARPQGGIASQRSAVTEAPHLGVMPGQFGSDFSRGVARSIVDNHQFKAFRQIGSRIEDFGDDVGQRGLSVLDRQEDSQGRAFQGRSFVGCEGLALSEESGGGGRQLDGTRKRAVCEFCFG
jgi:hypothetical protein